MSTQTDPALGPNISNAQSILGGMHATAVALYDTIDDPTLPNGLRKVQLKKLVGNIDEMRGEVAKLEGDLAQKKLVINALRGVRDGGR